jgi:hypothetical protein
MPAPIRQSVFYSQNFLKDPCLVASLLDSCSIDGEDVFLPGNNSNIYKENWTLSLMQPRHPYHASSG